MFSFFSDYFLFFLYGLLSGYFFRLWQIAKQKYPLAVLLLYTHGLWLAFIVLWMSSQLNSIQAWCIFGGAVFFAHLIPLPHIALAYFKKKRTQAQWRRQARKWQEQREREHKAYQQQTQFRQWEEQFRREREAKAYQAWQEGLKQKQNSGQESNFQGSTQNLTQDKRSYEQILGLSVGWTQEDLKKAYQRETQRTHPDKWVGKPEHLRKLIEEEYKAIQRAYKILKVKRIIRD